MDVVFASKTWWPLSWLVLVAGCSCHPVTVVADAGECTCAPASAPVTAGVLKNVRSEPTSHAHEVAPLAVCDSKGRLPLDAAREYFDHQQFAQALSCAAQASALSPNDVLSHTERANALAGLNRLEEAKLAYARALAIDPDSIEALAGAAHLYAVQLPSTREMDELGSLYAERGFDLAQAQHDDDFSVYFARLAAMALNDIGQSKDALERADWVLERKAGDAEALYERAVALFELCRFDDAAGAFRRLVNDKERAAFAHHHLGLLLERKGLQQQADDHFKQAQQLDGEAFAAPVLLSGDAFRAELDGILKALPDDMRRDLKGVPVEVEDIPQEADLTANEPPLSPTILGLFRGPPLGEACEPEPNAKPDAPCRSVVVYRRNLARAVRSKEELVEQIRVTLLHEIGHLRGEDDGELAARGLE